MDQKDKESIGQIFLIIFSAAITFIVSDSLQSSTSIKIITISVILFITFILYTSIIGRPWPRSYYKFLVCNGSESDVNSFFWTLYGNFEMLLSLSHSRILDLNKINGFAYLSLENNSLKIEAENTKTLDKTCNFVKELLESTNIKNLEISKLNFQNKVIARLKMNSNFRASTTHMLIITKVKLKKSDFGGIQSTSEILNLTNKRDNDITYLSWPEEKGFLILKDKSLLKDKSYTIDYILEMFEPVPMYDYPIIRSRKIILDECNADLIYSVTIDAKWKIPYYKSFSLFNDAKNEFNEFLNVWNSIDNEAGVEYRFKDCEFISIRIQDGINAKKYAKKIVLASDNN